VPVESLVRKFEHVRFEPSGMTRNPEIPIAKSLVDYIFRYLAMEFIPGYRAANAPKRGKGSGFGGQGSGKEETGVGSSSAEPRTPNPEPSAQPYRPKAGNGHGPRMEIDTARSFHYESDAASASQPRTPNPEPSAPQGRLALAADPLSQQGTEMQADAPACDVCGAITVRSGTCYKCLNCGNSMGCS
jgi:ribonucleoside-diphosphate reductase alpha chain